jgi:long-chain fatty acid transport protein
MRQGMLFGLIGVLVVLGAGDVAAQADGFAFTGINFDFTNPGARARGIGGAFVAIADDSTAAIANPAGLAYLGREVTLEWIQDEDEYPVAQMTQGGVEQSLLPPSFVFTAAQDPFRVAATSETNRLSYGSVLFPMFKNRATLALFTASLADLEADFSVGDGLVCIGQDGNVRMPGAGEECVLNTLDPEGSDQPVQYLGQQVSYQLKSRFSGAGFGYRLGDRWSLGATVGLAQATLDALSTVDAGEVIPRTQTSSMDDDDLMWSAGILYRDDRWGFGASYRSNATFEMNSIEADDDSEELLSGDFVVPDRAAVGVAYFAGDHWVISAEVAQVGYSEVLAGLPLYDDRVAEADIEYRMDDVTEYHLGAEYTTFVDRRGWSVRFGWWRDERHLPYVDEAYSDPRTDPEDFLRARESFIRAPLDEAVDHFTAGIGLSSGIVRLDLAYDWTDEAGSDFLISGVLYF